MDIGIILVAVIGVLFLLARGSKKAVSSQSHAGEYRISPAEASCTCPDWQKRRSAGRLQQTPCRVCKHLASWYHAHPEDVPAWLRPWQEFIAWHAQNRKGFPVPPCTFIKPEGERPYMLDLRRYEETGWVNLFLDGQQYGWNEEEGRWSRGKIPPNEEHWIEVIAEELDNM